MNKRFEDEDAAASLRDKIIGLGERSLRKSYYPQLVRQLEETAKSEARYRTLVENINDVIFSLDPSGTVTYVSPVVRAFGVQPEEAVGRSFEDFVHPDDRAALTEGFKRVLGGTREPHEFRLIGPDGSLRHVRTSSRPVMENGRTIGLTGAMTDITERKQAEAALLRLNQELRTAEEEIRRNNLQLERRVAERTAQLEAANKELEAFSFSVSHDLRAPLRIIEGFIHILREDCASQLNDKGRDLLDRVHRGAQRMEQLIDDILAFSRAARTELASVDVDMEALARDVVAELAPPPGPPSIFVGPLPPARGDRAMLRQVLVNLVSNALKFSRVREAPAIAITGSTEGGETIFSVKDNGVGFDSAYADRLFGVFERLHSASEFEGTGIGLAIAQRIVNRHGGRIWAEAKAGEGATFHFTLPRADSGEGSARQ
ncbi:MAG TPA: PAS domain S-box protein [Rhodocyclaceae bacterium]